MKLIDPPGGWRYDFPKPIPDDVKDVNKWLVENGYPQEEIDKHGEHFYYRVIYHKPPTSKVVGRNRRLWKVYRRVTYSYKKIDIRSVCCNAKLMMRFKDIF